MQRKLYHPLRTHLPAAAGLVYLIVAVIGALPLPAKTAVHFDLAGVPNRYGSPWEVFGITIGLSAAFICFSAFLDEVWARQEKEKSFNWVSLFDEIFVGLMVGVSLGQLDYIESGAGTFTFPWNYVLIFSLGGTALAIVLDMLRPFRAVPGQITVEEERDFETDLSSRLNEAGQFLYWDSQNPAWVSIVSIAVPLVMVVSGIFAWYEAPWVSLIVILTGLPILLIYGGQRTLVTRDEVTIRWGTPGFRVLRLGTEEINAAEIHDFSPLKDFGGYGIRINREMKAYYMRGSRGVKLTAASGKKYLIGSDHPERLLAVIETVLTNKHPRTEE